MKTLSRKDTFSSISTPSENTLTVNSASSLIRTPQSTKNALILFHRAAARKMAQRLLIHWNARIEDEEIGSIADLALCEAAKCYDERKGAGFSTYLFFYLRGFLIREISTRRRNFLSFKEEATLDHLISKDFQDDPSMDNAFDFFQQQAFKPDDALYSKELQNACGRAVQNLSDLERKIVLRVHVFDFKVAAVARQLGYSRGRISEIRRQAFFKLRENLEPVDFAA